MVNDSVIIIDRRKNDKRSPGSRVKAIRRIRKIIDTQVKNQIVHGSISDIAQGKGKVIKIPAKGLEPFTFSYGSKGKHEFVSPGNPRFIKGDHIERAGSSGENGPGGEGSGDMEDTERTFDVILDPEEYKEYMFRNCKLPYMKKRTLAKSENFQRVRAGFTTDGVPSQMNIERTFRISKARRGGIRGMKRKKLRELKNELDTLMAIESITPEQTIRVEELKKEIKKLKKTLSKLPFLVDEDLRYNQYEKIPVPTSQAVVFMVMDTSWSMGNWEVEMAKRFFSLFFMFIKEGYKNVEVVFIAHTTTGKEVYEEEFFNGKNSGGTVVSSGLRIIPDILDNGTLDGRHFPLDSWNVYVAQVSDGDNWWFNEEKDKVTSLMKDLLDISQYYAYIEIGNSEYDSGGESVLLSTYKNVKKQLGDPAHFQMRVIGEEGDIYPVFLDLFEEK